MILNAKRQTDIAVLSPKDAWSFLSENDEAVLVDVRTVEEWQFVGIPSLSSLGKKPLLLSWREYPGMELNGNFISELEKNVPNKEASLLFLCRSGMRSYDAAVAASNAGYHHCVNVGEGFEGETNADGHRGENGGWKAASLPWEQS